MNCHCRCLFNELARSCLFFLAGAVWASGLVVFACLLNILLIRLSMAVRSGGGYRYKAFWYPVPSVGAVYGGSSTELLVVLCGYWFCLSVSGSAGLCFLPGLAVAFFCIFPACLRFWPGQAVVFLPLVFLLVRLCVWPGCRFVSSSVCRRRRCLLPVGLVLHVLLVHFSTLSLLGYRELLRFAYAIRCVCVCACVCVRFRGLGLGFFFWFSRFYLLSVSLVGGAVVDVLLSCLAVLLRASAVALALACMQLSYVYSESREVSVVG